MSDFEVHPIGTTKRLDNYIARLRIGQPREQAWLDSFFPDAKPMTKAEIIMRREEALKMRYPLIHVGSGPLLSGCCM